LSRLLPPTRRPRLRDALAAADTLRGLSEGEPCANAARIAQENGANLAACTEPSRPDTMDVRVSVPITGPFAFLGEGKGMGREGGASLREEGEMLAGSAHSSSADQRSDKEKVSLRDVEGLLFWGWLLFLMMACFFLFDRGEIAATNGFGVNFR